MTARQSTIGLIWAQASNGVIGRDGTMPWHLPEDFEHFRRTTAGHPVIMGRRTWESLPARFRPLPGRTNIVITSSPEWAAPDAIRAGSLQEALEASSGKPGCEQVWIIGGGTVYREAITLADTAIITVIDAGVEGDTYAPVLGPEWEPAPSARSEGWDTAANGMRYRFEAWTLRQ